MRGERFNRGWLKLGVGGERFNRAWLKVMAAGWCEPSPSKARSFPSTAYARRTPLHKNPVDSKAVVPFPVSSVDPIIKPLIKVIKKREQRAQAQGSEEEATVIPL